MARAIVDADDDGDYDFSYTSDISEAERPPVLPAREYIGEIVSYKKTQTQNGKPNLTLGINISPDQYPVDYNPEIAPDGVTIRFRSQDLGDTFSGRYNAKKLAAAMRIPRTNGFKEGDFLGKKVKVALGHYDTPDGPVAVIEQGKLPVAI